MRTRNKTALAPSAWIWASDLDARPMRYYRVIVDRAVRAPDPYLRVGKRWLARRLAPDCARIEILDLPKERDEIGLLHAMGCEIANIHLGNSERITAIQRDLTRRQDGWLHTAAEVMTHAVTKDWKAWRRDGVT
jgi:hypothetical protein